MSDNTRHLDPQHAALLTEFARRLADQREDILADLAGRVLLLLWSGRSIRLEEDEEKVRTGLDPFEWVRQEYGFRPDEYHTVAEFLDESCLDSQERAYKYGNRQTPRTGPAVFGDQVMEWVREHVLRCLDKAGEVTDVEDPIAWVDQKEVDAEYNLLYAPRAHPMRWLLTGGAPRTRALLEEPQGDA